MDLEKLIFIILAVALSIFSMYSKSKKQRHSVSEKEESEPDFFQPKDSFTPPHQEVVFEEFDVSKLLQTHNISSKKHKKKPKTQNLEKTDPPKKNVQDISQNNDLMNDSELLGEFEGTEIQKAFLYSEIFKNAKN